MLTKNDAAVLRENFRGELVERGDEDYDDARSLYNAMIDKKPAMIARYERDLASAVPIDVHVTVFGPQGRRTEIFRNVDWRTLNGKPFVARTRRQEQLPR